MSLSNTDRNIIATLIKHRYVLGQLVKRDVLLRYRGAMFGVLWIFLSPLLMLAIYAFVFNYIFQARWPQQDALMPFWLMLYLGLIIFNLFGETISRAPIAVRSYPSYVKKIIFPVEILPLVPLGAALVHMLFNFLLFVVAVIWFGRLPVAVLLFPFLIMPVLMVAVGLSWFLAAWGVFIKDMTQIVPLFVQMLLFLSPVFYPISSVPSFLQPFYKINPIGVVIEAERAAITGDVIHWSAWLVALVVGAITAVLGYIFFRHSRDEFADAL